MPSLSLVKIALRATSIGYVFALIVLPLAIIVQASLANGLTGFLDDVTHPQAWAAVKLTVGAALLTTVINAVFGTMTAVALVRYDFPGRWLLNSLVDLPFAIPTLVAGLMIVAVYGPTSFVGSQLESLGLSIIYERPGIVLAMVFVTMPFVVRALQPVLMELEREQEEAAFTLGASAWVTFWKVTVPATLPGLLTGVFLTFVRALGEFGSIVIAAGNIPMKTQVAAVYVYGEIESYNPRGATSVSVLMLVLSFVALLLLERLVRPPGERLPAWLRRPPFRTERPSSSRSRVLSS